jgi:hypothetical protein
MRDLRDRTILVVMAGSGLRRSLVLVESDAEANGRQNCGCIADVVAHQLNHGLYHFLTRVPSRRVS